MTQPPAPRPDSWRAADYAPHSGLQAAMAAEVLARLALRGDERLLDLGCGDGKLSVQVAQRLAQGSVLGVDASADMIGWAQRHFGEVPNLRFEVADARALPYREAFDQVLSFNALHWVPDQEAALRGIRRALRPGGRALLRLVTRSETTSLEAMAEQVRHDPAWAGDFGALRDPYLRLDAAQYRALAEACGLRVLALEPRARRWDFGSDEAFYGFCHAGFGAWTRALPEARREPFVREVLRRYEALIAERFGERHCFHFMQTDVELAPGRG
ncbi:MAG: methyltransferase domain-containing protein [Burkholderiales bacterium]|nr:methyltransferase domain-containing protein [Burkholderiales bacterium]